MTNEPVPKFPPVVSDIESWLLAVKSIYAEIRADAQEILQGEHEDD
jgi:hypothetical protein